MHTTQLNDRNAGHAIGHMYAGIDHRADLLPSVLLSTGVLTIIHHDYDFFLLLFLEKLNILAGEVTV